MTIGFRDSGRTSGDVFDRYLVRVAEMRQSFEDHRAVAKNIPEGDYTIRDKNIVLPEKKDVYGNIEGLMNHFMLVIKGLRPPVGEIYSATEAANGELGFLLSQRQQRQTLPVKSASALLLRFINRSANRSPAGSWPM